jgi:hypothetical protein
MNFDVTSGFVSMSDIFNDVCIFVIFMLPFCISYQKMMPFDGDVFCFVLGLFCNESFAR